MARVSVTRESLFPVMYKGRAVEGVESLSGSMGLNKNQCSVYRSSNSSELSWALTRACFSLIKRQVSSIAIVGYTSKNYWDGVLVAVKSGTSTYVETSAIQNGHVLELRSRTFIAGRFTYNAGQALIAFILANHADYPEFVASILTLLNAGPDIDDYLASLSDTCLYLIEKMLDGSDARGISEIVLIDEVPQPTVYSYNSSNILEACTSSDEFKAFTASTVAAVTVESQIYGKNFASKFVGDLPQKVKSDILRGFDVLISGPTGTGKSLCVDEVCAHINAPMIKDRGFEGYEDVDIIGTPIIEEGTVKFIDGPLVEWFRLGNIQHAQQLEENKRAEEEGRAPFRIPPAVFFMDEVNRLKVRHQNLFLGAMTPDYRTGMRTFRIPNTQELLTCHPDYLVLVAARNVGVAYSGVHLMDPAFVGRFRKKYDVAYLPESIEQEFIESETGLSNKIAELVVKIAADTRFSNPDMQAPLDTRTLLYWAEELSYYEACGVQISKDEIINTAKDIVYEVCVQRNQDGSYETTSDSIMIDSIEDNWKDIFG